MDYKPRFVQPFTFREAIGLDVSTITDEIARLQNSLAHLQETQQFLREHITESTPDNTDPEISKAVEENETVIGSQTERIEMLKLALKEKGVILSSSHYDAPASERAVEPTQHDVTQGIDL